MDKLDISVVHELISYGLGQDKICGMSRACNLKKLQCHSYPPRPIHFDLKNDPYSFCRNSRHKRSRELLEKSYDASVTEHTFPVKQYPSLPGLKTVIDSLIADNPKAKEAKPEDFIDSRFVKELDERGFIDNLKNKKP